MTRIHFIAKTRNIFLLFLFLGLLVSFTITTSSYASKQNQSIQIVSFNVLAPCWASPIHYTPTVTAYLDRVTRRKHIIDFLNSIRDKTDIIALQETTQTEFGYFKQALDHDFYAFQAYHDPHYWSNWITPDIPWEPNGVAIFVKKASFTNIQFQDLPLTRDGNHSAYVEALQTSTGLSIRAVSVHLDNDDTHNRNNELRALLDFLGSSTTHRDIIAGDFNSGTNNGMIKRYLNKNHFIDVLHYLKREETTHPFDTDDDENDRILDHIVVKNSKPINGHVINFNLWKIYPQNENKRVIANLEMTSSDHFPLYGIIE